MEFCRSWKQELMNASCTELATGLPNTYGFTRQIEKLEEMEKCTDYVACYFDIVRMGQINNCYGTSVGNMLIKEYAKQLKAYIQQDEMIGRFGGNVFAALIKKENVDDFLYFLQDVPVSIEIDSKLKVFHVSAIAGVYQIQSNKISSYEILNKIATAQNYAKNSVHTNYVFLDEKLEQIIVKTNQLENDIKEGLINREFVAFYQPKVDSRTGKAIGAEALVRWMHNDHLVSPAVFIPVMEKSNMICNLDFYMLETVCKDIHDWIEKGVEPVEISINFSRKHFGDVELVEKIHNIVTKYNVPPHLIQIEITETLNEHSINFITDAVNRLKEFGISCAIDDFGSGSSSINLLKYGSFQDLKVDKSFVEYSNEMERQLLSDIIRMAKNMKMNVVAEGVENEEQIADLNSMGCYIIQGYFYDKPCEKECFEQKWIM